MGERQWISVPKKPGVRYYKHPTRKRGVNFDRHFEIRFKVNGETFVSSLGWSSEDWTAEKAESKRSEYKENAKEGKRPRTIVEEREDAEKDAKTKAETEAEEAQRKVLEEQKSLTFAELFNAHYIPFVKAEGKKSWSQEASLYKTWIDKPIGTKSIYNISPIDIERIKHKVGKDRSERTVQYCLAIIRRVYNFAITRDLYEGVNPTKKVKFPSPDNARVRFFTRDQADTLLLKLREKSPQLAQITEVSLFSGLRWGEVAGLLYPDVNIDQKTIFVRDPKNKHSRTVPMPERLQKMFRSIYKEGAPGYIFPSKKGGKSKWVSRTVKRVIDDMALNDGITDSRQKLSYHSCRHSFCSWLAMEGVALHTIGALAGHRNLRATARYSHLLPDTLQAAVSLLDKPSEKVEERVIEMRASWKE
jgi:site-specific recombinase XerD